MRAGMIRNLLLAVLLMSGLAAVSLKAAKPESADPGLLEQSRYIDSFDGTRIAVSIFRPARSGEPLPGPFPVIVTQDRSARDERSGQARRYFVDHGHVVVAQDRRGTGASFGTQTGFVTSDDLRDAKAVIEWAAGQWFSTGAVGAMGCSNQGVWQYGVAALHPKGLKAIAPGCASPQFFDNAVTLNGVPMFPLKASYHHGACPADPAGKPARSDPSAQPRPVDADRDRALLREALETRGCTAPMLGQYWLNMPRDGWNAFALDRPAIDHSPISHWREIAESGVAILQLGGWFDAAVAGQLQGQRLWGGRLIMGPWVHGNRVPEGADFPEGEIDLHAETLRWFDHFLKGESNGEPRSGVQYYVLNARPGEEWRSVQSWPSDGGRKARFHLTDGVLSPGAPTASAVSAEVQGEGVRWFDGKYAPLARWWNGDMAASDSRSLVHTTEPLPRDAEMTGTPVARLWIRSDASDLNVYAVIEDVAPDGRSSYVTDGRIRASWRALAPTPRGGVAENWHRGLAQDLLPLQQGEPTELVFDFFPIAYNFKAGHRIRVALTTSIGEGYQQPPSASGKVPTAELLGDAEHPSLLDLPLIGR